MGASHAAQRHGRERVAQFLIGVSARFTPLDARITVASVNGMPALVARDGQNRPAFVVAIETGEGKIRKVWAMANPDKLHGVA